ncbi:MAG: S49 family peptidase [Armatimonadota bacterium]|nr:S49 family peptidase [Armatimonadota bacterium]
MQDIVRVVVIAIVGLATFWGGLWIWGDWNDEWSGFNAQFTVSDGYCNIAVVPITGDITTLPSNEGDPADPLAADAYPIANVDDILNQLRRAESDPDIEGILVRIDSLGGTPVASEILADAIKALNLPVAALIREYGTSGGYLAATGADTIFASPLSDVGSIGITMSYLENVGKNTKDGLRYVQLASAPFKDYGDPNKPLTAAERALFERDLKIYHGEFIKQVAANRNLPVEDVAKLADGSSMPGALALENRLIDTLGNQAATRSWFAQQLGLTVPDIEFCE